MDSRQEALLVLLPSAIMIAGIIFLCMSPFLFRERDGILDVFEDEEDAQVEQETSAEKKEQ